MGAVYAICSTRLLPVERSNPLDLDLRIKRAFHIGDGYEGRILSLLKLETLGAASGVSRLVAVD